MGLAKELVDAIEKMIQVITKIIGEFEGDNGLIQEMKNYELKKNIAKTTGYRNCWSLFNAVYFRLVTSCNRCGSWSQLSHGICRQRRIKSVQRKNGKALGFLQRTM